MKEQDSGDLWVFGYGSLMWRPGFDYLERRAGLVRGYHRSLCVYSFHHRGTPQRPGLVMGLDRGGSCRGAAFRVPAERRAETIAYLREREQVTSVYLERFAPVALDNGHVTPALVYVVNRDHEQYAGRLDIDEVVAIVRRGHGVSGHNPDYVRNTLAHLHAMGVRDAWLEEVVRRLDGQEDPEQEAHNEAHNAPASAERVA
ncbi:gamma-glutamylcyclotransferase [Camelimonas abortus]|uniref:glutathione-specific gamma-glutamylcyclotransferase n=1 Tax=Camelimonas abortus TaxID=1017184 RepID=A0ABV7LGQ2_9HYPH